MTNAIEHIDAIKSKIHTVRGQRVMLDKDLASLYGVEVRVLNQAVKRNIKRFPEDFMFQLNAEEWEILKSHFVTSSWGGARKVPYAFTEQGVAMLSSVLKSETAIEVNIRIMRAFVATPIPHCCQVRQLPTRKQGRPSGCLYRGDSCRPERH